MNFIRTPGCFAIATLIGTLTPAHASPEDCGTIAAAFAKMGTVPAFHQKIEQDGTSLEATAIDDTFYMLMDGEITELPMPADRRQQLFAGVFDVLSVKECTPQANEDLDGRATLVFDYVLPPDGGLIPEAVPQRVWIGADDGMPYKVTNPTGQVVITYEGVKAPAQ